MCINIKLKKGRLVMFDELTEREKIESEYSPEEIYDLMTSLFGSWDKNKRSKFIRTVRHNKHPVIMNPSYGEKFDEYKMIGTAKLQTRAELIKTNKEFGNFRYKL